MKLCHSHNSYRPAEEVKAVREEKDAIKLVEAYAREGNLATLDELKVATYITFSRSRESRLKSVWIQDLRKSAIAEVEEAVKFSLEGTELPPQELYTDIYTDQAKENLFVRGADPFTNNKSN